VATLGVTGIVTGADASGVIDVVGNEGSNVGIFKLDAVVEVEVAGAFLVSFETTGTSSLIAGMEKTSAIAVHSVRGWVRNLCIPLDHPNQKMI